MPLGPTPEPASASLVNEVCLRLNNPADKVDTFTLRRYLQQLQAALRDAPHEMLGPIYGTIGSVYHERNELGRALDAYRNAARLQPDASDHENNIAAILFSRGEFDEGLKHLAKARAVAGSDRVTLANIACTEAKVYQRQGRNEAARLAFEEAARLVDEAGAAVMLRVALHAADLGYKNDAVEFFARHLILATSTTRAPDEPAVDVIRRNEARAASVLVHWPQLTFAVQSALDRWDAPVPEEHEIRTAIELEPDAWARLCDLARLAPEA